MANSPIRFVYVTCRDADEAKKIARVVVEEKLAACGNVFSGIQSIYRDEGKVVEAAEAVLLLKTTAEKLVLLEPRIAALHSYKTPCIGTLTLEHMSSGYAAWLQEQLK